MTLYRLIAADWVSTKDSSLPKVLEGEFNDDEIRELNQLGYNIYYLPNYPSFYEGGTVEGHHIDTFTNVFVDMDLKDGVYKSKEEFISAVGDFPISPSRIVDSGHGIHVYWKITDLDAKSFLRLQRRLTRALNTDEAVGKIYQLMRYPGTLNTKIENDLRLCELIYESDAEYTCEVLDAVLAPITLQDEEYCNRHYLSTYNKEELAAQLDEKLPLKFAELLSKSPEVKDIWAGRYEDRSKADYRLGHILFASTFTKKEALSVLVNSAKALERAPAHRLNYAQNIIDKIWTFEIEETEKTRSAVFKSVKDILAKGPGVTKGVRFPCWTYIDNTEAGFRLGQVIGLVAGVGVGKTAIALNMFEGFVQNNPDYNHLFVTLEQPDHEIAERWQTLAGNNQALHERVHVLSNYSEDGSYRNLSLEDIERYILEYQKNSDRKIGCVVIDHIGVLKKNSKDGRQSIEDICHKLKSFAISTSTMLVIQSQAPREKAGIGDLELNKDAAYGTVFFESYCDYMLTVWQPLKRCYNSGAPTVTAFKFCKIRHKNQVRDTIKEDVCYKLLFDPQSQRLRTLTADEETSFTYFLSQATNKRKQDRKTDLVDYVSVRVEV